MTDPDPQLNYDELITIGQILLGAAFVDGEVDGHEVDTISDILIQLTGQDALPEAVASKLEAFDPASFDLDAACGRLHLATPDDRRALLSLIAEVTDADDIHTCDENDYILRVARNIGAQPEEYDDLTMEMTHISSVGPPPIPRDA